MCSCSSWYVDVVVGSGKYVKVKVKIVNLLVFFVIRPFGKLTLTMGDGELDMFFIVESDIRGKLPADLD